MLNLKHRVFVSACTMALVAKIIVRARLTLPSCPDNRLLVLFCVFVSVFFFAKEKKNDRSGIFGFEHMKHEDRSSGVSQRNSICILTE